MEAASLAIVKTSTLSREINFQFSMSSSSFHPSFCTGTDVSRKISFVPDETALDLFKKASIAENPEVNSVPQFPSASNNIPPSVQSHSSFILSCGGDSHSQFFEIKFNESTEIQASSSEVPEVSFKVALLCIFKC
jgi:hypothetical protein